MWHSLLAESARATPVARARLERRGVERRGSNSARPAEFRSRRRAREVVLASSGHREVSRSSADATSVRLELVTVIAARVDVTAVVSTPEDASTMMPASTPSNQPLL